MLNMPRFPSFAASLAACCRSMLPYGLAYTHFPLPSMPIATCDGVDDTTRVCLYLCHMSLSLLPSSAVCLLVVCLVY